MLFRYCSHKGSRYAVHLKPYAVLTQEDPPTINIGISASSETLKNLTVWWRVEIIDTCRMCGKTGPSLQRGLCTGSCHCRQLQKRLEYLDALCLG
jgi:hypothetical protein